MSRFLSHQAVLDWLSRLLTGGTVVVAPTQVEGVPLFRSLSRAEEADLDCPVTVLSPKEWFFPLCHTLFTLERQNGAGVLRENRFEGQAVLFGLHPCDALGIHLKDMPFLAPPADGGYGQLRERTALVGVSCPQSRPECFCTSVGTAPDDASHLDVLLTPVAGGYLVAAANEQGEAWLSSAKLEEQEIALPSPATPPLVPAEDLPRLARHLFDHAYWQRLADRCLHCNICAYVCPCCYCFDIRDYSQGAGVERVRSWESCQSPGFTRIAGGYDPRATKGARLRQRFYHKFLYFPQIFGALGCTGCGRCVRACPVNIDIREIINDMQRIGAQLAGTEQ